ncbi:hypothetical protein [Streptomyces sp. NPDC001966]
MLADPAVAVTVEAVPLLPARRRRSPAQRARPAVEGDEQLTRELLLEITEKG